MALFCTRSAAIFGIDVACVRLRPHEGAILARATVRLSGPSYHNRPSAPFRESAPGLFRRLP